MKFEPHINEYKRREVEEISNLTKDYPVIGLVDLQNLPALTLQQVKKQLKERIVFKFSRKRLMKIALENSNLENKEKLRDSIMSTQIPVLIFTKEDPFMLYKLLDKNKTNATAKPGQIAPYDLIAQAGLTNFPAGPIIGELGQLGVKTEVKEGKINIKEDKVIVEEGQVISQKAADILTKLGIEPMKIGVNLLLTYQKGEILTKDILGVSSEEYESRFKEAFASSINLAVFIGYISKETVEILIKKSYLEAKSLADISKFDLTLESTKIEEKSEEQIESKEKEKKITEKPVPEDKVREVKEEIKPERQDKEETKAVKEEVKEEFNEKSEKESQEEGNFKEGIVKASQFIEMESVKNISDDEIKIELKNELKKEDEEVAQEVLKRLTEQALKEQDPLKIKKQFQLRKPQKVDDISKLINELKDKKSKGQI